ncbi:hypothetical protein RIR_jg37207.t1 [Rhizophagus irregularis DAOM 181602=DAOM 197198]|nr:hypothetical protein RIR_jg37207.t1 [Rhizophagus irregularis DAOM 181602=DAOM 197198]
MKKSKKIQIIKIPKTDITITITTTIVTTAQDLHHILLMQTTLSQNWNHQYSRGYKTKLIDIINYFDTHNFNILGLTETQYCHKHENNKLVERHPHPTNKNLSIYIILDANGDNRGSGVGIMLTSTLYQHVHQIRFHKGRVLNIELGFKLQPIH